MLHKTISISMDVNRLPLPAKLLFTWMIPHADDEGRLRGEPEYIKATVVPMTKWSIKKIEQWLKEMEKVGLIHYWEHNNERLVEFVKWTDYQYIQKDRLKLSKLPSYSKESGYNLDTDRIQTDDALFPQSNIGESNLNEANKSELNEVSIAAKPAHRERGVMVNPRTFKPSSEGEVAALEAWRKLEPSNPLALKGTYLHALQKGLPTRMFYQFVSEIQQDDSVKRSGAVFNKKVVEYFKKLAQKSS